MSTRDEIWVIGTDPPCLRCDYLAQMAHELVNELNLPIIIRHLAYTDDEARQFARSFGLELGTAKDVAKKAGIEIDWDEVRALGMAGLRDRVHVKKISDLN
jgi:thiol-disulfide isomerase/thioredoxin